LRAIPPAAYAAPVLPLRGNPPGASDANGSETTVVAAAYATVLFL